MADRESKNFTPATVKHPNGGIIDEAEYMLAASNYDY
jgi:hypothetical protein